MKFPAGSPASESVPTITTITTIPTIITIIDIITSTSIITTTFMTLTQIAELLKGLPEAHRGFVAVCQVLVKLLPLLKAKRFLSEEELVTLETGNLQIGALYPRVFGGTVPPKIHDQVFHLGRLARHLGTVGGIREDGLEAKHAIGNALRRRLACVRADEERLMRMVQLDEAQQQLKSAGFSKPTTSRLRKPAASKDSTTATTTATTSATTVEAGTAMDATSTMDAGTAMDAVFTSNAAITATATTVDVATNMGTATSTGAMVAAE